MQFPEARLIGVMHRATAISWEAVAVDKDEINIRGALRMADQSHAGLDGDATTGLREKGDGLLEPQTRNSNLGVE